MICKDRPPAREKFTRASTKMKASLSDAKSKYRLVEARGFEPGASCAQANPVTFASPSFATMFLKTKALSKDFGCVMTCEHVVPHAEGPPNFPLSQ
jgi:hypothetical protein